MSTNFSQLFGKYLQDAARFQAVLEDGEILRLEVEEKARILSCDVRFEHIQQKETLQQLAEEIRDACSLQNCSFVPVTCLRILPFPIFRSWFGR